MKEQEEYQRRLEYYRAGLKENLLHMQAVGICMKRRDYDSRDGIDNRGNEDNIDEAELKNVRKNTFLHVWLPVITEYVEWVLEQAIASGKKRLYFLARDGYMMYLMAQKLADARKPAGAGEPGIELRYLKVSRFAIRNAEYYFIGRDALDTLCAGGIDVTFEKIMKRAGLTDGEALHIARLAGRMETYKTALSYRQLRRLKEDLSHIDELFLYIKRHSEACYETTAAYLRQEGLSDEIPYALVDSGWIGSLQLSIQRILSHEASKDIKLQGYYFGIYERPNGTEAEQYKAFYFSEKHIRRKVRFSNCLFETVMSAPEGMTCRYEAVLSGTEAMTCRCGAALSVSEGVTCGYETALSVSEGVTCGYETALSVSEGMNCGYESAKRSLNETCMQPSAYIALENEVTNPNAEELECFAKLLSEYALVYTELIINSTSAVCREQKKRVRFAERLLSQMMGNPARLEAKAFGEMLFCDDVLEFQLQPVAAVWDEEELRKNGFINKLLIKLNLKSVSLRESAWPEGSITRLGIKIKNSIRQERLYKRFMYLRKAAYR